MSTDRFTAAVEGSSKIKYLAVMHGLNLNNAELQLKKVPVNKIDEQPVGFEMINEGARRRAFALWKSYPDSYRPKYCFGIENGIVRTFHGNTFDLAVICILNLEGKMKLGTCPGIIFPETHVDIAHTIGFDKHTVGSVMADGLGFDPVDPHGSLLKKYDRTDLLTQGVTITFDQVNWI